MKWKDFTKGILTDALPKDRKKYVKFSNLASINKKMVKYYLDIGKASPERRVQAVRGILEEMLRSSNERYDIEDSGQP
tara:strand:- start:71 stop:304 length:234 start_codon:yes stop_codon:yes gene_type:complete